MPVNVNILLCGVRFIMLTVVIYVSGKCVSKNMCDRWMVYGKLPYPVDDKNLQKYIYFII